MTFVFCHHGRVVRFQQILVACGYVIVVSAQRVGVAGDVAQTSFPL